MTEELANLERTVAEIDYLMKEGVRIGRAELDKLKGSSGHAHRRDRNLRNATVQALEGGLAWYGERSSGVVSVGASSSRRDGGLSRQSCRGETGRQRPGLATRPVSPWPFVAASVSRPGAAAYASGGAGQAVAAWTSRRAAGTPASRWRAAHTPTPCISSCAVGRRAAACWAGVQGSRRGRGQRATGRAMDGERNHTG